MGEPVAGGWRQWPGDDSAAISQCGAYRWRLTRLVSNIFREDAERSNVGGWQRLCAHVVDVGAHRLRKRAA